MLCFFFQKGRKVERLSSDTKNRLIAIFFQKSVISKLKQKLIVKLKTLYFNPDWLTKNRSYFDFDKRDKISLIF